MIKETTITAITELDPFDDEYAYDLSIEGSEKYFFANRTLIHNSCYFSIDPALNGAKISRDEYIETFDSIADQVNDSFPEFMHKFFNTSLERGAIIKGGRELICSKMLFVKKKKYCGLIYDKEGTRYDTDNNPGLLKVMGLDLKRADTPDYMQEFLEKIIMEVLTDAQEKDILNMVKYFRSDVYKAKKPWEKGSPKKVSNLSKYRSIIDRRAHMGLMGKRTKADYKSVTIPGHVQASINYNKLREMNGDKHALAIVDGTRIMVCKLKPNVMKMDSVAYPTDEPHLPQWFKDLPFDELAMEEVIIDKKIYNILSPMNWDLASTKGGDEDEFFC